MKKLLQKIGGQLKGYDFFDTLKHTSTYFSATILINVLGLISLPIYTSFLTTAEFGIVEVFNNTVKILAVFMTFNTHQSISRYYFEKKEDWREFIGGSFITTGSIFITATIVLLLFKNTILYWLNIPEELYPWLIPATLALAILAVFNQLFIAKKESLLVSKGQIFFSYGRFLGAIICLFLLSMPFYYGRVVGDVVVSIMIAGYLLYKIWPNIKWNFKLEHLKYNLKFALPLIPFSISGFILHFFDLFMINAEDNANAGVYAFAYKIGFLFMGLDQALHNAAKPDFYKWMNAGTFSPLFGQIKSMLKFQVIGSTFLILFAADLGAILASKADYTVSLHLVSVIVVGYLFYAAYNYYSRLIFFAKKTIYISIITLIAGVVNVILNSIYIPIYGYEVAAYTTLVSFSLMFFLGWILTIQVLKMPAPPLLLISSAILFGIVIMITSMFINEMTWSYFYVFTLKLFLFVSVGAFLFGGKILSLFKKEE